MTTNLPHENLDHIQNGEPVSGGNGGNSDGVLNRPVVQVQANVKALRDAHDTLENEVKTARGDSTDLNGRLGGIDQNITDLQNQSTYEDSSQVETLAVQTRDRIPSSFDYSSFEKLSEEEFDATTARSATPWHLAVQTLDSRHANMANKIAFLGEPKNLYVDGYKIHLDARPLNLASVIADLGTAPVTGTRLDYIFLEVWKEEIKIGEADSVVFPNGAVHFDKGNLTVVDGCALHTGNATGGNYPAYLASATGHGAYVKCNDANIAKFLQNPSNNVVKNGDQYYQIRWRVRVYNGLASYLYSHAHQDSNIKAQGQLAAPSSTVFAAVANDAGLSKASHSTLAIDGIVRAVPIAVVHRRNSTAWSLTNPNGADPLSNSVSAAMHGKFYDHIHFNDVCDLRHHGMFDNAFDYKAIYERNLNKILESNLMTTFEPLMSDSDGNEVYKDLDIYGTKLLRAEGLIGSVPFEAGWEVINCLKTQNGVSSKFDGIRNYYSDVGGEQAVYGLIPAMNADGVNPTSVFTYVAETKTLTFDATDLESNNGTHAARTKISTRRPHLKWGVASNASSGSLTNQNVAGEWTGLGGDSASLVVDNKTHARLVTDEVLADVEIGTTYKSENNVICTVVGLGSKALGVVFTGATAPATGTYTLETGTGNDELTVTSLVIGNSVSASGATMIVGLGSNIMPANAPIHCTAYLTFAPGSGFMNRIPHQSNDSFIGSHFYVNGTQVLPNGGKGFIPFGSTVYPVNDGNLPVDSHSRTSNLMGFLYKKPVMDIGTAPNGYNSKQSNYPKVLKDGNTYKMWFCGLDAVSGGNEMRLLYTTSPDGITWQTPQLVIDKGTSLSGYSDKGVNLGEVLKDGSTYKMWFHGKGTDNKWRVLYTTSSNGITWNTPQMVWEPGRDPNGFDSVGIYAQGIIKDGSTFKGWFQGQGSVGGNILYSTSTDGITWSLPVRVRKLGDSALGYDTSNINMVIVIKEGNIFKMLLTTSDGVYTTTYSTSTDGINWSEISLLNRRDIPIASTYLLPHTLIKDGPTYKMWSIANDGTNIRIVHAVLTMTDPANVGSSTTGVYPTTGSLNHAPPANSQVVVFYEALADQCDRAHPSGEYLVTNLYNDCQILGTGYGTGTSKEFTYGIPGRDTIAGFLHTPSYKHFGEPIVGNFLLDKGMGGSDPSEIGILSKTSLYNSRNAQRVGDYTLTENYQAGVAIGLGNITCPLLLRRETPRIPISGVKFSAIPYTLNDGYVRVRFWHGPINSTAGSMHPVFKPLKPLGRPILK